MPERIHAALRVAAGLVVLASTGCGTIHGWSKSHPADVSRLFLGTRVDACWMVEDVPDPLKNTLWGLNLPSPDPEKPAVANTLFFLDMPFSVAADVLMAPVALVLPLFRDHTAEQLCRDTINKLSAAETLRIEFRGSGQFENPQEEPLSFRGRMLLKSGNRALLQVTTDWHGYETSSLFISDGTQMVFQLGSSASDSQPTPPALNANFIRAFVRVGPYSWEFQRSPNCRWYSESMWAGVMSHVVDHTESMGTTTLAFETTVGSVRSETGKLQLNPTTGLPERREVEKGADQEPKRYRVLRYVETITKLEMNKDISDEVFLLSKNK